MDQTADVVVMGGGVIGCFIAYELSKAGLEVVVVEKDLIGAEASSASAGLLVPFYVAVEKDLPLFERYLASLRLFPELVPELQQETGIQIEYNPSGVLRVALSETEEASLYSYFQSWGQKLNLELEWLDQQAVRTLESDLAPSVRGGIFSPEEASLNSGRLTLALARAAAGRRARFLEGCRATDLRSEGGRFLALRTGEGEIAAGYLVVAAGAWSQTFCDRLGLAIPIVPARGQMLAVKLTRRLLRHPVLSSKGSISPKADGTIHVGATVDLAGFDKRIRPEDTIKLLDMISTLMPQLREGQIEKIWAGLRPFCQDGLPVVGMAPGWDNIAIAAGHFQLGITGSAITARIIRDLIVAGQSELALDILSPARFVTI